MTVGPFLINYYDSEPIPSNVFGIRSKPVLVLLHGMMMNFKTFFPMISLLESKYRVIAIDLPGHGGSWVEGDLVINSFLENLANMLVQLKISEVVIAGHSMGGTLAIKFAASYPNLVKGVTTFCSPLESKNVGIAVQAMLKMICSYDLSAIAENSKHNPLSNFVVDLISGLPDANYGFTNKAALIQELITNPDYRTICFYAQFLGKFNIHKEIKQLKVPWLGFFGSKDQVTSLIDIKKLKGLNQKAILINFPNQGHYPFITRADICAGMIAELLF